MRLVANGPGIGDSIVLSAVARAVVEQRDDAVELAVNHPELYDHAPGVTAGPLDPSAPRSFPQLDHQNVTRGEHNVRWMCGQLGLEPPPAARVRQFVDLVDDDRAAARLLPSDFVAIHTNPSGWTPNRHWARARWAALVEELARADVPTVLVGGTADPGVSCDYDRRGLPLRQVAGIVERARVLICSVSGIMHLASGVGTRAVVIYGGREDPAVTGYPQNVNLTHAPPQGCAPCWAVPPCPHGWNVDGELRKPCTEAIGTAAVIDAAMGVWGG